VPEFAIDQLNFPAKITYILREAGLCKSSSDARRQISNGGIRIEGEKVESPDLEFTDPQQLAGKVIQVGKKIFLRLILS